MQPESSREPLAGIRVLDFTRAMAGPFATMLLGDLGSDVIKVEPPTGDETRNWAPPHLNGVSSYFLSANRNKRSICLDLKNSLSGNAIRALALKSDVVVENFRPGTAEKLGIDYSTLKEINPKIIYCSISGYGQDGPYREKPGFDLTVLASSGLMSITGEEGGQPVKFGVPVTDITSGLFAVISILSALHHLDRTGKGQYIDLSMMDANMLTLTHQATSYFATQKDPVPLGSAHASIAPYQVYETADGHISIAVGSEKLWRKFCPAIGLEDMAEDPKLSDNSLRVRNRSYLNSLIMPRISSFSTEEALKLMETSGIPASKVNKISDLESDPQVKLRKMLTEIDHPGYGRIRSLGTPFKSSETPGTIRKAPPLLGEHTEEILSQCGFGEVDIKHLISEGAVYSKKV